MNNKLLLLIIGSSLLLSCGGDSDEVTDDFSAFISVSASSTNVEESAGTANFTIAIDKPNTSGSPLNISFRLSGPATENSDFEIDGTTAIIAEDENSVNVPLTIIDDNVVEEDEEITLVLTSFPGTLLASLDQASFTIIDNDTDNGGGNETSVTLSYGTATGSSITISEWTDTGADSYVILINAENSFSDFTSNSSDVASTTYVGYGEQVVYNGASISSFSVSLLDFSSEYFFKVIPVKDGSYDNMQATGSSMTSTCATTSTTESQVCFEITSDLRIITSNQYPNHPTGNFPNYTGVDGLEFLPEQVTRELDLTPVFTNQAIYVYDETGGPTPSNDNFYQFGMAVNGVEFHPMGLKPWENPGTGEQNWAWQAKVTEEGETDLDQYGAHVTSQGNYHYHGDITGLADEDGTKHSAIYGFAADGFPIYYKYSYTTSDNPNSAIVALESSYRLKSGARTGTGTAGEDYPDGDHDGTYIQDFEYVPGLGDLDECNGRTGITPEYPEGTYYYVITSGFPVVPNCFFGTPADDWKIGK